MNARIAAATARPYFVSTTIPYVNGPPHAGHALECVQADAIARYRRLRGDDVRFVSGSDENSLKNARAAEREGVATRDLVARNSARFLALREALDLSYDDFIRTSAEPRHEHAVRRIWERCNARGDIYRRSYSGLYCVGCEQYYRPGELEGSVCPEHGSVPETISEENYFFRLSRHQDEIARLLRSGKVRIQPEERRNEAIAWVEAGLEDFSISRSRGRARDWGLAVPGDPGEVVYVWFDALVNYVAVLGYADDAADYQRFWAGPGARVHLLGKGVLRFHAVHWLAILLSAGLPLPSELFVHGYLTAEGNKIGKSLGNVLDPFELAADYGTDALRYYLLRHQHSTKDGDFSRAALIEAHDGELADQLGNLVARVLSLAGRHCFGRVPATRASGAPELVAAVEAARERVESAIEGFALHDALRAVLELVAEGNRYVDRAAPWKLVRERSASSDAPAQAALSARLFAVLGDLLELLRVSVVLASPFVPRAAAEISSRLELAAPGPGAWSSARFRTERPEFVVQQGPPLFPKLAARAP